jgi:hypothetical protein
MEKTNTVHIDKNGLDIRNCWAVDNAVKILQDAGFSRIWISPEGDAPQDFFGKRVQIMLVGSQWEAYKKRTTEKTEVRFVTGISWGDAMGSPIKNLRHSANSEKSVTLPVKTANKIRKSFSDRIVVLASK